MSGPIEWWSTVELLTLRLAILPQTERGLGLIIARECWRARRGPTGEPLARKRQGRGGGWEYHVSLLPHDAVVALAKRAAAAARRAAEREAAAARRAAEREAAAIVAAGGEAPPRRGRGRPRKSRGEVPIVAPDAARHEWFAQQHRNAQARAAKRAAILDEHAGLVFGEGLPLMRARQILADRHGVSLRALANWLDLVRGLGRQDWEVALIETGRGRKPPAEMHEKAWQLFLGDYLRLEQPPAISAFRRTAKVAAREGWAWPRSIHSAMHRLHRDVPAAYVEFRRRGEQALKRTFPSQRRDKSCLHAMEVVNADGHTLDVWVTWPDGELVRPVITVVQDVYSGKILAWRADKSENAASYRLAIYDTVRDWGVPDAIVLDNTMAAANKEVTGGQPTRFRGKVTPGEAQGVLTALGVRVIWALPYSGQSKPVERAFRDFCGDIARHPTFAGCWAGNTVANKPDYPHGRLGVAFKTFADVLEAGVAEHNARPGRRSPVCDGRSFDAAFAESFESAPIRRASEAQLRVAMLSSGQVTVRAPSAEVHLHGNRYWAPFLAEAMGDRVTLRFDPDDLGAAVHVYAACGRYLGAAGCLEVEGFTSVQAAKDHAKRRRDYAKAVRRAGELAGGLAPAEVAALQDVATAPAAPEARIVKMVQAPRSASAVGAGPEAPPCDETPHLRDAGVLLDRLSEELRRNRL